MSEATILDQLLSRWQDLQAQGQDDQVTRLCAEHPELRSQLRERIERLVDVERALHYANDPSTFIGNAVRQTPNEFANTPPEVPGYEILGVLGEGGMGVVYKARQVSLDRLVALKMILGGATADLGRFHTEAEVVARLQHPGIVQIHETGVHQGRPYFSLEYLEGGSLDKKLGGAPLPPPVAARLVELLARAVQAVHDKGILHRDLKPGNVLLMPAKEGGVPIADSSGKVTTYVPKVSDFGLAKKLEREEPIADTAAPADHPLDNRNLTRTGFVMGTPSYMAPEQAAGRTKEIGKVTDVYALGAILYSLLTGRPPFRAASERETLNQVIEAEPVPPRRLNPATPRDLETICLKCLLKEPSKRFRSAQEVAEDLMRYLEGKPILARPANLTERTIKWVRRRPAVAGLILAAFFTVLALAAGTVGTRVGLVRAREAAAQAERDRDLALNAEQNALEEKRRAEAAERNAKRETSTALAVTDFLQHDLLGQADIGQQLLGAGRISRDANVRVRELLDRAAAAIPGRFNEQPLTEAAIRHTIGETYLHLGEYDQAELHCQRALELCRQEGLADDHARIIAINTNLAKLYIGRGKYERAVELLLRILDAAAATREADDPHRMYLRSLLAIAYVDWGKFDKAEPMLVELYDVATKKLTPGNSVRLAIMNSLGVCYYTETKYQDAAELFRQLAVELEKLRGSDDPGTLLVKQNLAVVYDCQNKPIAAEELLLDILSHAPKVGANHPCMLNARSSLGGLYLNQGELLDRQEKRAEAQKKYAQAEPLLAEQIELLVKYSPGSLQTLMTQSNLAFIYLHLGRQEKAESLFLQVLSLFENNYDEGHDEALLIRRTLASLYVRQEKWGQAEPLYARQLAIYESKTKKGPKDEQTITVLRDRLASARLKLKDYKGAEKVLRSALEACEKNNPDDWSTFHFKVGLGAALKGQMRYGEAETLLLEGYERLASLKGATPPKLPAGEIQQAITLLVELYDEWGKKKQADQWRLKLPK